jgi:transposase
VSLHPRSDFAIPEETRRVAHAAFPKGALGLRIADELGPLYRDDQFAELFPTRGLPAASPARLAMASVLQYIEGLSDRQAAEAVRGRIDWKYAPGLELTDPGFDHTVLSEFRSRLVQGRAALLLLDTLLDRGRELELIRQRGRQRTDSTHVLAAVRVLNRLERVGETMRAALNDLAVMAPDWLQALAPAEWSPRYGRRVENYHLPKTDAAREELARVIAADGERLLAAVDAATDQPELAQLPTVVTLRRVWAEHYTGEPGQLRWRAVMGVIFSSARRRNVKAFRSSGTLNARNAATSNGSPRSGRPFRLVSHQMARAVAASARPIAKPNVTCNSRRSLWRSNWSSFGDVPLTAVGAGAGLSCWVSMRMSAPGEARSAAGLSGHPNHGARFWQ